jgi:hypothetical protein
LSTLSQQVIIKRIPTKEILQEPNDDTGAVCDCVEGVFHTPNPNCLFCNGTGVIKVELEPKWIVRVGEEKKIWVTNAQIVFDNMSSIYDDDEQQPTSNIHAFFSPEEDVKEGDYIIPAGGSIVYIIETVEKVRSLENDVLTECILQEFKS